jgi:GWxTD domain-containing protein
MTRTVQRKARPAVLLAFFFTIGPAVAMAAQEELSRGEQLERLREDHRTWLEEEVVYIITDREEDVFLSLETLEERTRFIEVFWEKRDPYPATPANEFRDEHYARIEYANKYLGRDTFRAGWRTDRGRYYILLGEPRERHSFDGYNEVVSSELWFYQGDVQKGLPSFFYLVFFKRHDIGEYRLYHPVVDGPQSLVRGQYTQGPGPEGNVQAYETLQRIDAELANASLSFDPSEPGDWTSGRASLGSDLLIARVEDSPRRAIRTDYADAWLRYRDRVSADYSFNFVPSRGVFGVTGGPSGTPFVHFSVEIDPQNFTLETDEDQTSFYTTLDISVEAVNEDDVVVLAIDRPAYLELTPAQVRDVQASPFAYQDSVPLLPGQYEFSVIVRNRAAQQFTVLETEIDTTGLAEAGSSRIAGIVAGFDGTDLMEAPSPDAIRTFQVGSVRVQPAADGLFALGNVLYAFAHVMDAGEDQQIRFQLLADDSGSPEGEPLAELTAGVPAAGAVLARMPLDLGVGGSYWLRARLEDSGGALLDQRDRRIQVSPRAGVPRAAFVYRRGFNPETPGLLPLVRGDQYLTLSRFEDALREYEAAVASGNPQLPAARWKLAHGYIQTSRVADAAALLEPMVEQFPEVFEVASGIGFVRYFQNRFEESVTHLEHALSLRTPGFGLLNVLGDAYAQVGRLDEARTTFQRSLEMNPEQPFLRERLAEISAPPPR